MESKFYKDNANIREYVSSEKYYFDNLEELEITGISFFNNVIANLLKLLNMLLESNIRIRHSSLFVEFLEQINKFRLADMQKKGEDPSNAHNECLDTIERIINRNYFYFLRYLEGNESEDAPMWFNIIKSSFDVLKSGLALSIFMSKNDVEKPIKNAQKGLIESSVINYRRLLEWHRASVNNYIFYFMSYNTMDYFKNAIPRVSPQVKSGESIVSELFNISYDKDKLDKWHSFSSDVKHEGIFCFGSLGVDNLINLLGCENVMYAFQPLGDKSSFISLYVDEHSSYYAALRKFERKENPLFKKVFMNMCVVLKRLGLYDKKKFKAFLSECDKWLGYHMYEYSKDNNYKEMVPGVEYFYRFCFKDILGTYIMNMVKGSINGSAYIILKNCYDVLDAKLSFSIFHMRNPEIPTTCVYNSKDILEYRARADALRIAITKYLVYFTHNDNFVYTDNDIFFTE